MEEIGRAEWFAIGITGMALAGVAHAAVGAAHIAREMLRAPTGGNAGPDVSHLRVDTGPGGWFLFSILVLTGGIIYHVVSGFGTILKEIVRVTAR